MINKHMLVVLGIILPFITNAQFTQQDIVPIVISKNIYARLDNVITQIDDEWRNKLIFNSNSGRFFIEGNNLHFIPTKAGYAALWISYLSKGKDTVLIGQYSIFINKIPEPKASIGTFHSEDTISANDILFQPGLSVAVEFPIEARFSVLSYDIICLRNDSIIYRQNIDGPHFSEEMKDFIKTTKHGDLLIFKDIKAINMASNREVNLRFLCYIIK